MKRLIIRLIRYVVIPAILIAGGFGLSLYYYREASINTLQYNHPMSAIRHPAHDELYKGDIVTGEFTAAEDNLGTVAIPITTFNRINNDIIVFELREKGATDWYCFNKYFTDRFPNDEPYPFGFPVVRKSHGKTYEFRIFSVNGLPGNAVGIVYNGSHFESRYTFARGEITGDKSHILRFAEKKFVNLFSHIQIILYLLLFIMPVLFYLAFLCFPKSLRKYSSGYVTVYDIVAVVLSVIYILQPVLAKSDIVLFLAGFIFIVALILRAKSAHFFAISLLLLIPAPVWLFVNKAEMANRSAVIVFFLIIIGLILLYKEKR